MRRLVLVMLLIGCGTDDVDDPFSGETRRYALYKIELPVTEAQVTEYGGDLNANRRVDNALGNAIRVLADDGDVTMRGADMIAGGSIATSLEITADDFAHDDSVGIRYHGMGDESFIELAGWLDDGKFGSIRLATTALPAAADLHLPVFTQANPSVLGAVRMELTLEPDVDDGDVFRADVHAVIPADNALWDAVYSGLTQMIASDPADHRGMLALFDYSPTDGIVSYDEVKHQPILASLLSADLRMDDRSVISFGYRAYFRACADGQCVDATPFDHCFDRKLDADETDVDCGGSCRGCEAGASCAVAADCETITCEQGRCGPPSCTDGVRDGLESDVDCGASCPRCAQGQQCYLDGDCASLSCGITLGDDRRESCR